MAIEMIEEFNQGARIKVIGVPMAKRVTAP